MPGTASRVRFTPIYIGALWRSHPIQPFGLLKWGGAIALLSSAAALAAMKGYFSQFLLELAGENMGPRTAIVLGAISLCVVCGVITVRGPFLDRVGWFYRIFGVAVPKFALGTWGTLSGISLGVFTAALAGGVPVGPYVSELCLRLFLFGWGICVFTAITVIPSDAPGYATRRFKKVSRLFAAVTFVLMVGWFITGGLYAYGAR